MKGGGGGERCRSVAEGSVERSGPVEQRLLRQRRACGDTLSTY